MKCLNVLILCLVFSGMISQEDPVLFKVDNRDVHLSEFEYIYTKNNQDKADYSQESLDEYLDLYVKFKLKVAEARSMGLDTVPRLKKELQGYRKKLADSYLSDKEVSEKLFDEVYERMQYDIKVAHILVKASDTAGEDYVKSAEKKIRAIKEQIRKGSSFESVAKSLSDDTGSAANGGVLGYFTAMLPPGFYEFENALYSTPVGEVSQVVRTNLGFHILKILDKRPARGEMEVAHLLLRKKIKGETINNAEAMADSIYRELKNGGDWDALVGKHSMDKNTVRKGGNLGFFGINQYDRSFEDAAFALLDDGEITKPVETKIGYHIIKRIQKRDLSDREAVKRRLKAKIEKAPRAEIGKSTLINKIQTEAGFKEFQDVLNKFSGSLDSTFLSYKWKIPNMDEKTILEFGSMKSSNVDFAEYCLKNSRTRLRFNKNTTPAEAALTMYDDYKEERTLAYEEANLENKYPEFKALMREYSEGILLFEVTKMEVWDKASLDTTGLKDFYKQHKISYQWKPRARLERYTIETNDKKLAEKVRKEAKKKSAQEVLAQFNKEAKIVSYQADLFEMGSRQLSELKWKKGAQSDVVFDQKSKSYKFSSIRNILEVSQKSLDEAKGYVIADYQDELEKRWIAQLKNKYPVEINEDVYRKLIK